MLVYEDIFEVFEDIEVNMVLWDFGFCFVFFVFGLFDYVVLFVVLVLYGSFVSDLFVVGVIGVLWCDVFIE